MKNEPRIQPTTRLTPQYLQKLKDSGFKYVQIKSYTWDNRQDYISPHYFMLIPIKDFSDNPINQEIYEPINSQILKEWSRTLDDRITVLVSVI